MTTKESLAELVDLAAKAMEGADEILNQELNLHAHASEEFKTAQRQSNAVLRVLQALEILKYEL